MTPLSFLLPLLSRGCHEALSALEIPNDLLQVIQDLLLELRVHCLMVTLLHTTEGEGEGTVTDGRGYNKACLYGL